MNKNSIIKSIILVGGIVAILVSIAMIKNDTFDTAVEMRSEHDKTYSLGGNDVEDWWKTTCEANRTFVVNLTYDDGIDFDVELYYEDGSEANLSSTPFDDGKIVSAFCNTTQKMHIRVLVISGSGQYTFTTSSYSSYYASEENDDLLFTNSVEDNQTITVSWSSYVPSLDLNVGLFYMNGTQVASTNINATTNSFSFYCEQGGDVIIIISQVSGEGVFTYSVLKESGDIFK